jgi:hypothetical protein
MLQSPSGGSVAQPQGERKFACFSARHQFLDQELCELLIGTSWLSQVLWSPSGLPAEV